MSENYSDAFIKANANKGFITANYTEHLRSLLRAISTLNESPGNVYAAVEQMSFVMKLIEQCDEKITYYDLFDHAVNEFRNAEDDYSNMLGAAQRGMSYFIEASCKDSAAKGRTSKKESSFFTSIKHI